MTMSIDIKPAVERIERDLRDRPARRLIQWGATIFGLGVVAYTTMHKWAGANAERYDGVVAIVALLGGILIIAAVVVRLIQGGRRDEIRQEVTRAHASIETERARRDIRMMDLIETAVDMLRRNNIRTEDSAAAVEKMQDEVTSLRESLPHVVQETYAAGQVSGIEMAVQGGTGRPVRLVPPPRS